jgi:hypothetical protein
MVLLDHAAAQAVRFARPRCCRRGTIDDTNLQRVSQDAVEICQVEKHVVFFLFVF